MGLQRLNRRGGDILDPVFADPGFKRADRALEKGAVAGATVVGIEQKFDDSTTNRFVAVAIPTANGTRTAGVQVMGGPMQAFARLRLGVEVIVRHDDGDAVVLDWPAMCARWGIANEPAQKRRRKPPAEGVIDKAIEWGAERRLKKWTPARRRSRPHPAHGRDGRDATTSTSRSMLDGGGRRSRRTPRSRSTPPGWRRPVPRSPSASTRRTRRRPSSTGPPRRTSRAARRVGSTTRRPTAAPPRCSRDRPHPARRGCTSDPVRAGWDPRRCIPPSPIRARRRASIDDPDAIAERLAPLLAEDGWLAPEHQAPGTDSYRQHLLHVSSCRRLSVVALVWRPGQARRSTITSPGASSASTAGSSARRATGSSAPSWSAPARSMPSPATSRR